MLSLRALTILCRISGAVCVILGVLVLAAQAAEWWSFGDWNTVSIRYVLGYFNILRASLISNEYGFLDLPISFLLIGSGALIALLGKKLPRRNNVS